MEKGNASINWADVLVLLAVGAVAGMILPWGILLAVTFTFCAYVNILKNVYNDESYKNSLNFIFCAIVLAGGWFGEMIKLSNYWS